MEEFLKPTEFLDSDHDSVREFAERNVEGATSDVERAVKLYYAVRDGFQYDPYVLDLRRGAVKASALLTKTRGYCVEKAILLAACARAIGIPSRLSALPAAAIPWAKSAAENSRSGSEAKYPFCRANGISWPK